MTTGSQQDDQAAPPQLAMVVDGQETSVPDDGASLLDVLRNRLGKRSVKDGCSPQGQCGCCTVLVDGQPRVSCVTPARRVRGRSITTMDGLEDGERWADALCATGGSQCGFCTPGIVVRLSGLAEKTGALDDASVRDALKAHLCRCTGWQSIVEAAVVMPEADPGRDLQAASARATLEGGAPQVVSPEVSYGRAGFADDTAPGDALIAVRRSDGEWAVGETLTEARERADKIQGRRTTAEALPPIAVPDGDWSRCLQTSWVEPAYLETDASWCRPGEEPVSPLANGGAFGGKLRSDAPAAAKALAELHGRPVRVLFSREDTVLLGPKRPPLAAGIDADGSGEVHVARTPGIREAINAVAPDLLVREVDIVGPPTSASIRGAGWVEAAVLLQAVLGGATSGPSGAVASAVLNDTGISVEVRCGSPLDAVVLRSYCLGAAHMAYSWVTSEALAVNDAGDVLDLTLRSSGVVRAVDTPAIAVEIVPDDGPPVNGSDAVFAAVAAAVWRASGFATAWPTGAMP